MTETVTIEKQVWESMLNHSMKLQAENETIKDYMKKLRDVIQSASYEQISTEIQIKMIKIIDNILAR